MFAARTVLPILLGTAIGAGGLLKGLHRQKSGAPSSNNRELENLLRISQEENALLLKENDSLRSLAQGGGELAVPQELLDRVEHEFDLKFQSSPIVHRLASEELQDRIGASYESRFGPAGIDFRQEAYMLIGWLKPEDNLLAQFSAADSIGAITWFDDESGDGWVTDRFNIDNIPDQAALLQILARILLNQNFTPPPAYPGDDAARARHAMHFGAAAGVSARFLTEKARTMGFVPMNEDATSAMLLSSLSPFVQGLMAFDEIEGKSFAESLYNAGNEKLREVFRAPPVATQGIFDRALRTKATGTDREVLPFDLPDSDEPFLVESAGQLGLKLWLQPLQQDAKIDPIWQSWVGDEYRMVPDGEMSSAVVWQLRMDSAESADRLLAAGLTRVAQISGVEQDPTANEIVPSSDGRFLAMKRIAEDQVRFIHSATEESAEKWLR